jgi:glycerophosphoryl diester phosphodiesterase
LDAGYRFAIGSETPFRGAGVRVPTLREVLERYPSTPLLIELKVVEAQGPVRDELIRAGAERRVVVASFLHDALAAFRRSDFLVGASRRDIVRLKAASWLRLPARDGSVVAYAVPDRYKDRIPVPTPAFIRAATRLGRPVHVWTVDEPARARQLWDQGAAGIITNYPARIRAARDGVGETA